MNRSPAAIRAAAVGLAASLFAAGFTAADTLPTDGRHPLALRENRAPRAKADPLKIGGGAAAALFGATVLHPSKETIPREGFDPDRIALGLDRGEIRPLDASVDRAGDALLAASALYPRLHAWATAPAGDRASYQLRSLGLQIEAACFTLAATAVAKTAFSRPRPNMYLYVYDRTDEGPDWGTSDGTFESFPSRHASLAWGSAVGAVTFAAVERPDLPAAVHFLGGMAAGAMAASTSLLRVEAGAHFPTDVAAGAALGSGIGIAVPLLHARGNSTGRGATLRSGLLGVLAGSVVAALAIPPTSPF
jgi:membrane-associated phospholipid phosphatase